MGWLRREDIEDRELRALSPWAAQSRDHGARRRAERPDVMRTAFQRDRDRIIHCTAFRRLQHKTQVLAAFEGDHFRSRMTHSLEVAQMARSVCIALSMNADLAEAIALAHDLGHPPFGHAGEEILNELMAGHGGFRHNAQGVRIVDYLEHPYEHGYGLNLARATRLSLLKGKIPAGYPLSDDLVDHEPPPIEANLVDLCDKIAYLCHDVDDGMRANAFTVDDVAALELWRRARESVEQGGPNRVLSRMTALLIEDLVQANVALMRASRERPRVQHGSDITVAMQELLAFLRERFYRSEFVLTRMEQGREKIRSLFEQFVEHPDHLPDWVQGRIARDGCERTVCDYVAGMTDRFLLAQ